jgi:hypothetical protein
MTDIVRALEDQGLRVQKAKDGNNHPLYYITDADGIMYGVSRLELEELAGRGELSLRGLKEHDERIRSRNVA